MSYSCRRQEEIKDLMEEMKRIDMFNGKFDAKNGSWEFMHGVATVMEYLAYEVSEDYHHKFQETFFKNIRESIDKAKSK